jgi:hypothetical protein
MAAIQFFHGTEQRENARVGSVCCVVLFDQLIVLIYCTYTDNLSCPREDTMFHARNLNLCSHPPPPPPPPPPPLLLLLLLTDKLEFSFDMISELYLLILSHNLIKIIFL